MAGELELQRDPERGVAVGCSYRTVRIDTALKGNRKRHRAVCSCGWEGPRRQRSDKAREDMEAHELDLIPASVTPGIVRTGDEVRVVEDIGGGEQGSFRTGRFVGTGLDDSDSTPLLFVQIGAGLHAFPAATTQLQPKHES